MSKFLIFPLIMHLILNFFPQWENNFYNPPSPHLGKLANSQNFAKFR